MLSRSWQPPGQDPSVAPVEEILQAAASRSGGEAPRRDGRWVVTHALRLCACETLDESPCWLVYAVDQDGIGWHRLPAGADVPDVVEAEHLTGGHPAPEGVLEWLGGAWPDPWRGQGPFPQHAYVFEEIRRRIRSD